MKIFQSIQKNFAVLGIDRNQLLQKHNTNFRNSVSLFLHCFITVSYLVYIVHIASTFREYIDGIFVTSAVVVSGLSMAIVVSAMEKWFNLIFSLESVIVTSKKDF